MKSLLIFFSLAGVANANSKILTTIPITKTWIEIIKPDAKITTFYQGNQDPHSFDVSPSLINELKAADEVILLGGHYDVYLESFISKKKIKFFKIFGDDQSIEIDTLNGKMKNTHLFFSVKKNLEAFEILKSHFNLQFFDLPPKIKLLQKLDEEMEKISKTCNRKIISDHGASLVFFNDYHFPILGSLLKDHNNDLSALELSKLLTKVDDQTIFINETGRKFPQFKFKNIITLKQMTTFESLIKLSDEVKSLCSKK